MLDRPRFHRRRISSLSRRIALLLLVLSFSSPTLVAQESLRSGQKVEVNVNDQWVQGRVLRVLAGGKSAQVRVNVGTGTKVGVVPLDRLRWDGKADANTGARLWTDSTGGFRIKAELVAVEEGTVKLRKPDGKTISVPINRLSKGDQDFLAKMPAGANANQPAWKVDSVVDVLWGSSWYPAKVLKVDGQRYFIHYDSFGSNWDEWVGPDRIRLRGAAALGSAPTPGGNTKPGSPPAAASAEVIRLDIPVVVCSLQNVAPIPIDGQMAAPQGTIAAAAARPPFPQGRVLLQKPQSYESWGGMLAADEATVIVSVVRAAPQDPTTRFLWCDVQSGRVAKEVTVSGRHQLLAGSADTGWFLTLDPKDTKVLTVWNWNGADEQPQPAYALTLNNPTPSAFANQFRRAWLPGGDIAIFENGGGRIAQWNLKTRRVQRVWDGWKSAVDASGRLAASGPDGVGLFDLESGRQTGFLKTGNFSISGLAFSESGAFLACLGPSALKVLDLQSGQVVFDGSLPQGAGTSLDPPLWVGNQHLLLNRQYLLDLKSKLIVWQYTDRSGFKGVPQLSSLGSTVGYIATDQAALCSVQLPHEVAKQAAARTNPQQLYALVPGGTVALQAGGLAPNYHAALEAGIKQAGWNIAANSPVAIVATMATGQPHSATFREGLAGTGAASKVTFTPTISEVQVQVNGEVAWRYSSESGLPMMIMSKQGQSAQEAMKAYETPDSSFFAKVPYPKRIVFPKFAKGLGKSEINSTGVASNQPVR